MLDLHYDCCHVKTFSLYCMPVAKSYHAELDDNIIGIITTHACKKKAKAQLWSSCVSAHDPICHHCREAVDAERAVNKAIGDRTGCWKAGVLVEDDAGSVKKALNDLTRKAKFDMH